MFPLISAQFTKYARIKYHAISHRYDSVHACYCHLIPYIAFENMILAFGFMVDLYYFWHTSW